MDCCASRSLRCLITAAKKSAFVLRGRGGWASIQFTKSSGVGKRSRKLSTEVSVFDFSLIWQIDLNQTDDVAVLDKGKRNKLVFWAESNHILMLFLKIVVIVKSANAVKHSLNFVSCDALGG